jgi:methyl-accepting chemotaxis protein
MQSDFSQILKAMEDLSTTVSSVATKTDQVSGLAHQTNADAQAGTGYVGSAEVGMKRIADSVHDVEVLIQEITREMDEIGTIVNVIGDISEQTNLLALNAAIEAARAGDAGKGFGVVADEVKGLANESRRSTEKVSRIISDLMSKTKAVSSAMDGTVIEVKSGNQSVTDTIQSFNRIVSSIQALSNHITDVAAASQEQAASVQEITATLNETNTTVTSLHTDATTAAAESEESTASIDEITKVVDSLSHTTTRIREMISKFKTA